LPFRRKRDGVGEAPLFPEFASRGESIPPPRRKRGGGDD
jgi:hypothetical protein